MAKKILFVIALIISSNCFAQNDESPKNENENQWEFDVTPYIWFSGLSSDISFFNQTVPVEASFSDIAKNLSIGGLLHAEAKKGDWMIITDMVYMKLKKDGRIELLNVDTELELEQFIAELAVGYNLVNSQDWLFIDVFGGLRYFDISSKLDVGAQNLMDRTINVNDPMIGIRFMTVTEKWTNGARFDIGGLGIGSEISWKGNIYVGYRFSELFTMSLGFQGYGLDYEKDAFGLDMVVAGLATGFSFSF